MPFDILIQILHEAGARPGQSFVDLGSGTGRAVLAAALTFGLRRCVGVEMMKSLAEASTERLKRWECTAHIS